MAEKKTRDEVVSERSTKDAEEDAPEVEEADYGKLEEMEVGPDWDAYSENKILYATKIDGKFKAGKESGKAGDYYCIDSDGNHGVITDEELAEKYVPVSEAKRLTYGPGNTGNVPAPGVY